MTHCVEFDTNVFDNIVVCDGVLVCTTSIRLNPYLTSCHHHVYKGRKLTMFWKLTWNGARQSFKLF
jgi:hypothetical protein